MKLQQFQELKVWHLRQGHRHPIEKDLWDAVLTVWLLGWVATSLGIRWSFGITLPLVLLAWWACTALVPQRGR